MQDFADDLCGLEPGEDEDFEDFIPDPRIKESRLTPEEKKKFLGLVDEIFHPDSVLGARVSVLIPAMFCYTGPAQNGLVLTTTITLRTKTPS